MFRNRGSLPHIEFNQGRNNDKDDNSQGFHVPHYSNYWNGYYYVVHYDAKLVIIQVAVYAIFLLIAIIVYLYKYNGLPDDPLMQVKNAILGMQLIQICVTIGVAALAMFLSKNKEKLIRTLKALAIISIFLSITITGIKLYMDTQYNDEKFAQFYEQYERSKGNYTETARAIFNKAWTLELIDSKEAYIRDSKSAYLQFTVKQVLYIIINILIAIGILILSDKISKIEENKERLAKDDIVLNDEEENVKY